MSDAWDAEDRAIARALDAASDAETIGADETLVGEYHEVLAHTPTPDVAPSPDLEDRVISAALARRAAAVPTLDRSRRGRYGRIQLAVLSAAIVAAAIVIGLIVYNGGPGTPEPTAHVTLTTLHRADIEALLREPGARTGTFSSGLGRVVIVPDGDGAAYDLAGSDPLAIGLVSSGGTTVLGPTRPSSGSIAFVVDHPERVDAVTLLRDGTEIASTELTPS